MRTIRRILSAFCLVALLSPAIATAEEKPPESLPLAIWTELAASAPEGSITYDEALPLGERGLEIKGLSIAVDPQAAEAGRLTIERLEISEIAPLVPVQGPPERLKLRIEKMILTPENSGLDPELFAALEATQIPLNLTLDYFYLPAGGLLALQDLTIDMPFLGSMTLTLDAAGLNLARLLIENHSALDGVVLRRANLTVQDNSLLARLLRFEAKRDGVSFDEALNEALREIAEELNWIEVPRGGRIWSLAEALGGMVIDSVETKGPLTVTLKPNSAVALGEFMQDRSAEDIARVLNLRSSYAGSRAEFTSTQSETPGRPDLSLTSDKNAYKQGEPVELAYSGLPGNQRDWVTVVPLGAPADNWGQWTYTEGKTNGTFVVENLEPGAYEARVYLDWPRGGFDVQRRWFFSVEP